MRTADAQDGKRSASAADKQKMACEYRTEYGPYHHRMSDAAGFRIPEGLELIFAGSAPPGSSPPTAGSEKAGKTA